MINGEFIMGEVNNIRVFISKVKSYPHSNLIIIIILNFCNGYYLLFPVIRFRNILRIIFVDRERDRV